MSVELQLQELRNQVARKKELRMRAQVEKEQAENNLSAALESIETNFKATSVEQAKQVAEKLREKLSAKLAEAEQALKESSD